MLKIGKKPQESMWFSYHGSTGVFADFALSTIEVTQVSLGQDTIKRYQLKHVFLSLLKLLTKR